MVRQNIRDCFWSEIVILNYGGFFKWWNNYRNGIPAYMTIDMRTQEVSVVRLEEGIKYSPSEYFGRDLSRRLRFAYPTYLFDDVNFEIDETGTPYWVASVIDKTIGLFDGADVIGAVLMNAVTGETAYYDVADIPTWVDRVYAADLLVAQYNYYGKYNNGYWNSWFSRPAAPPQPRAITLSPRMMTSGCIPASPPSPGTGATSASFW